MGIDKFLKSLTPSQLESLTVAAEKLVVSQGGDLEEIDQISKTQYPKRGNGKILYQWALLNATQQVGWSKAQWDEWEQMVMGWVKS